MRMHTVPTLSCLTGASWGTLAGDLYAVIELMSAVDRTEPTINDGLTPAPPPPRGNHHIIHGTYQCSLQRRRRCLGPDGRGRAC
jgi:hypothetical protein